MPCEFDTKTALIVKELMHFDPAAQIRGYMLSLVILGMI